MVEEEEAITMWVIFLPPHIPSSQTWATVHAGEKSILEIYR